MRRNRKPDVSKYIDVRISQLKEDLEKCNNDYDKQWYNRIINELHWTKQNITSDCYMEQS
jgi:hypothetical protein